MSARILVVDDVVPNVKLLEAKLTAEYFEVLTAGDGPSALEVATRELPDLILLDVMMPGMDGFETCRRLRADPRTRHIPVVMITALTDVSDRIRGLEAGADDFLSKPVNDTVLFARVRSLVRLKTLVDELRIRQVTAGSEDLDESFGGQEEITHARILLVDAQARHAERLAGHLDEAGHRVDIAASDEEALTRIQDAGGYDLAIVAMEIAGKDGLRLCGQIRSQESLRHLPILLVLEEPDLARLAKGLDLGVTDYLIKPIDRNELLARVRTQIRRRRYHARLRALLDRSVSLAYTDPLTGAYNRRYMNAYLERKLLEGMETGKPVSVMIFDIDRFKPVNDTHGHDVGDQVLRELTRRVTQNVRDHDLFARFGGEEFVLVMPDTTLERAQMIAERLRELVAGRSFAADGLEAPLSITISVGVATDTGQGVESGELLRRADRALYAAKNGGRNRVVLETGTGHVEEPVRAAHS